MIEFGRIGWKDPDPGIVAQLREIDPSADALWVPGPLSRGERWDVGRWWNPNKVQLAQAREALGDLLGRQVWYQQKNAARIRWLEDTLRGWRSAFHTNGPLDGRAVAEFQRRYYEHTHRRDALLKEIEMWEEIAEARHEEELSRLNRERASDEWAYRKFVNGASMIWTNRTRGGVPIAAA